MKVSLADRIIPEAKCTSSTPVESGDDATAALSASCCCDPSIVLAMFCVAFTEPPLGAETISRDCVPSCFVLGMRTDAAAANGATGGPCV